MNNAVYIQKENDKLPDFYTVDITFINNKTERYEVVSHLYVKEFNFFEITTHDDLHKVFILSNIFKIEFDKSFTNIVQLKKEGE